MDFNDFFTNKELLKNSLSSGFVFLVVFGTRFFILKSLTRSSRLSNEIRRQWIVHTRTLSFLVFLLGLLVIWASELQNFAVSLVAVAAAIVIAFKEMIMNVSGYIARVSAQPFGIGDRIEVGGIRGDVIDQNLFFTKIFEIGPGHATNQYTGRSVNIPNSTFLSQSIINESFTPQFTLHVFSVPIRVVPEIEELKDHLLQIANKHCAEFLAPAAKTFTKYGQKNGLETPSVEPRVHLHFLDKDTVKFIVRIPSPTSRKGKVEQEIINGFAKKYSEVLMRRPDTSKAE